MGCCVNGRSVQTSELTGDVISPIAASLDATHAPTPGWLTGALIFGSNGYTAGNLAISCMYFQQLTRGLTILLTDKLLDKCYP
jgi:hypothetical protein